MPVRKSEAVWRGTLKEGNGTMRLASGLYEALPEIVLNARLVG